MSGHAAPMRPEDRRRSVIAADGRDWHHGVINWRVSSRVAALSTAVALVSIVALGGWLRFRDLGLKSLYGDEIITVVRQSDYSWTQMLIEGFSHRTFHYLVTHYVVAALGLSEVSIRLLPATLGTLALIVMYLVGRSFFDRWVALLATALLAIAAYHVDYSQVTRFYAGVAFFSLVSIAALVRAIQTGRWVYWPVFVVAMLLNLYNQVLTLNVALACGVWGALVLAARYGYYRLLWPATAARELGGIRWTIAWFIISNVLILVLYIPALLTLQQNLDTLGIGTTEGVQTGSIGQSLGGTTLWEGAHLSGALFVRVLREFTPDIGQAGTLYGFLAAMGVFGMLRYRHRQLFLLISIQMVVPFVVLAIVRPGHFFATKYVIHLLPLYLLTIAYGVVVVGRVVGVALARLSSTRSAVLAVVAGTIMLALTATLTLIGATDLERYYAGRRSHDPRGAAAFLVEHVAPDDGVVILRGSREGGFRFYHARVRESGLVASQGDLLDLRSLPQAERLSTRYGRIWIVADRRGLTTTNPDLYRWVIQNSFVIPFNGYPIFLKTPAPDPIPIDERIDLLESAARAATPGFDMRILLELGSHYAARGDWDHAREFLHRLGESPLPVLNAERMALIGRLHTSQQDWTDAILAYQAAVSYRSVSADRYVILGDLYQQIGQPDQARDAYQQAAEIAGSPALASIAAGDAALQADNAAQAVQAFELATERDPQSQLAWAALAHGEWLAGRSDAADAAFKRAMTLPATNPEALFRLAQLELLRGNHVEAERLARQGIERAWVSPLDALGGRRYNQQIRPPAAVVDGTLLLGDIAMDLGNFEAARRAYAAGGAWRPYQPAPLLHLGALEAKQQNFAAALDWYKQAAAITPGSAEVQARLARTYVQLDRPEDAIAAYQAALDLDPDNWTFRLELAELLHRLDRRGEAEEEYRLIVAAAERSAARPQFANQVVSPAIAADFSVYARAYGGLADLIRDQEVQDHLLLEAAEQLYQRGLTFNPSEAALHAGLSEIYVATRRPSDALAEYQRFLTLVAPAASHQVKLGDLFWLNGEPDHSEMAYRKALELDPSNQQAYFHLGRLLLSQGRTAEAERVFQEAVVAAPENPLGYVRLGDIYEAQNDLDMALSYYEKALAQDPTHPTAYVEIGDLHFAAGEVEAAKAWYEQAYALKPDSKRIQRRIRMIQ